MSEQQSQILIVDDEEQMLAAMEAVIGRLGYPLLKARDGAEAVEVLSKERVDLIVSDMKMPRMTGIELLAYVKEHHSKTPFVMITAYGTITQAVEAMRNGAFDFVTKPFSAEDLEGVIQRALKPGRAQTAKTRPGSSKSQSVAIVSNDPGFKRVLEIATTVAPSNASVLIQGESGTGKELIAKLIHSSSQRVQGPFVAVNCAALPGNLLESELFGHEKGSFTGAVGTKIGKFELANGGTILLDEISEMEEVLQAKLLRVLQEREVDRVGGQRPVPIDVRVVATTNRDIRESVRKGEFREDLYYRLNVIPLYVPPLRERSGDIRLLVDHFTKKFSNGSLQSLPQSELQRLENHNWPGNIRELQNACERAVILANSSGNLSVECFFEGCLRSSPSAEGGEESLSLYSGLTVAEAEKKLIFETLRSTGNNKTKAAELLGISIRTLRNKLNEYRSEGAEVP